MKKKILYGKKNMELCFMKSNICRKLLKYYLIFRTKNKLFKILQFHSVSFFLKNEKKNWTVIKLIVNLKVIITLKSI